MKRNIDATEGPLLKKIILFSLPIIATNILQILYNMADQVVVGQCAGTNALSAVGCTGSLINLTLCFCTGLALGSAVCISHAFGAKNQKSMKQTLDSAMILAVICGVVVGLVCFFLSPVFLRWLGTPDGIIGDAALYLKIYYIGTPFNIVYNFGASMLRAVGDSKRPLIFLIISGLVNVILNCILDIGFGLGVIGVAVGTVASQFLSAILVVLTLIKGDGPLKLDLKNLKPDRGSIIKILRVGLPSGIQSALFAISNVIMQSSVNLYGPNAIAGNTAASTLDSITYWVMHSISEATLTFSGQNYGAKKPERVRKVFWLSLVSVTVAGLAVGFLTFAFRNSLLPLFIKETDPAKVSEIVQAATCRIGYVALPYFLCGIMDVLDRTLRGIGQNVLPVIMVVIGSCAFRIIYVFSVFRPIFNHLTETGKDVSSSMGTLFIVWPLSWVITNLLLTGGLIFAFKKLFRMFETKQA